MQLLGKVLPGKRLSSSRVEPITSGADEFFGRQELGTQHSLVGQRGTERGFSGILALRIPDPPSYTPTAVCSISPDGRIVAVGGKDVELYLWDVATGEVLSKIRGHDLFWVPSHDNRFFVTGQEDGKVLQWDTGTLEQTRVLGLVEEGLSCMAVAEEDDFIVAGTPRGNIFAWNAETGQPCDTLANGHACGVAAVGCYDLAGVKAVVSCGISDHTVMVWDLETAEVRGQVLVKELETAKNVHYNLGKGGIKVAVWCYDTVPFPNLVVVDISLQTTVSAYCHNGACRHAVLTSDLQRLVSCGGDGKICVWDTVEGLEPLFTLAGHRGAVLHCDVTQDCSVIVSGGEDCSVRLWSIDDQQQLLMLEAQDEPIRSCHFCDSVAGQRLLTCDVTGRAMVWHLHSEFILDLLRKYSDVVSCLALTSDHRKCCMGCNNGRVLMWDTGTRTNLWEYSHHSSRVEHVCFNSSCDVIATSGADGKINLISTNTGKQTQSFLGIIGEPVLRVAFSPDDERIAALSGDGQLLIYQATNVYRKPKHTLSTSISRVTGFVWSPTSKLIAGCCYDGSVMIWNATSGSIFTVLEGMGAAATCCAFDLIGKLLAIGTVVGSTLLYNLETAEELCELQGNASAVTEVVFNLDTSQLTTVCSRQAVIWDVSTAQRLRTFDFVMDRSGEFAAKPNALRSTVAHSGTVLFDHESEALVYDMQAPEDPSLKSHYLSDMRALMKGTSNGCIMIWSAANNALPDQLHMSHDAVTSVHFGMDDRLVVMGMHDGNVAVYDVQHSEALAVIAAHQNGPCRCVRFSHDNREVLSCGADAKVVLWDWRKKQPTRIYSGHFMSTGCCDMSSQGNMVASGDNHGMICVWEKETGNAVQLLPLAHSKAVVSLSMATDGYTIASVGADGKVSIWDVDMGMELVSLTSAIESQPLYCSFSPDGRRLAVTEANGNMMVWNVEQGCQWLMVYQAHKGKVTSCTWSADCRRIVTSGTDSVLALWDAESGAPVFKSNMRSGPLTSCGVSSLGRYLAGGSGSGTLSVVHLPSATRVTPEPSFLYHWLSGLDNNLAKWQYLRLVMQHPHLHNVQDARGWSLLLHAMSKGNAAVAAIVLDALPHEAQSLGMVAALHYAVQTRVKFHNTGEGGGGAGGFGGGGASGFGGGGGSGYGFGGASLTERVTSVARSNNSNRIEAQRSPHSARINSSASMGHPGTPSPGGRKARRASVMMPGVAAPGSMGSLTARVVQVQTQPEEELRPSDMNPLSPMARVASMFMMGASSPRAGRVNSMLHSHSGHRHGGDEEDPHGGGHVESSRGSMALIHKSNKSFSQQLKKVAVELFTEKRSVGGMELAQNNALALALNSKSSECVQVLMDAAAHNKVSWGSYHAIIDMMPALAARYPIMCCGFLVGLEVRHLGDLEVPVAVLADLDRSILRTAPIFTNVKNLWQAHLKLHEVKSGPQPYAHVKASMVRLPYACSIGKESLLQTLVESDVPVKAYATPTLKAVIKHKWRLYAYKKLLVRAVICLFYTTVFTAFAVLFAMEDKQLSVSELWASSAGGKASLVLDGYLFAQSAWYAWTEFSQMHATGLRRYVSSYWNILDLVSIALMLAICLCHVLRTAIDDNEPLPPIIAFEMILVWFKILFYALAFEPTGPFVHMVFQIAIAVRSFVVLLFMACCSFGVAVMVLYSYVPDPYADPFSSYGYAMLTMWRGVLDDFTFLVPGYSGAFLSSWHSIAVILLCIFMFLVQIVMLNLLIALMVDVYNAVRLTEEAVFLKGRAMLIVEVETLMSRTQLASYASMPPYMHLLTPVDRRDERGGGPGMSEAQTERLEAMLSKLHSALGANVASGLLGGGAAGAAGAGHDGGLLPHPLQLHHMMGLDGAGPSRQALSVRERGNEDDALMDGGAMGPGPEQSALLGTHQSSRQKDNEAQFPAVLRQLDRLQRSVNNQEMRMESVVAVLRDVEALLRNQQPVIVQHDASMRSRQAAVLSEAELEVQIKGLLGGGAGVLGGRHSSANGDAHAVAAAAAVHAAAAAEAATAADEGAVRRTSGAPGVRLVPLVAPPAAATPSS